MKKMLCLCLAAAILAGQAFAAFSDLPQTHWASESVDQMAQAGILEGYPDGSFRPDDILTRAQFLTMVVRGMWPEEVPQTDGAWWRPYYEVAQQKQLLLRDDGTPFVGADETQMNNPITRYEMAVVLIQAYRTMGVGSIADFRVSFTDEDQFPEIYHDSTDSAAEAGLLSGYPDGSFGGTRELKRAEGAAAVQRLLARKALTAQDVLIAANGEILLTYQNTDRGIQLQSRSVTDASVLQELTVSVDTSRMEDWKAGFSKSWAILAANDHAFWGTAGYFTYDEDGKITQMTDQPILDAKEAENGSVVAITCKKGTCVSYSGAGSTHPAGDQVIRISTSGKITTLLDNEPAHGLTLTEVTGAESGDIRVVHTYFMGMADLHRYEYLIEHGKLWALEHIPGMGFSGYTPEEAEKEQQRLDDAGCGLGTIHES